MAIAAVLTAVVLAVLSPVVPPPISAAAPETCPPICDAIPASAWPDARSLPLDSTYHWPVMGDVAMPVSSPRFQFEELCATPMRFDDARRYAVSERVVVGQPDNRWSLQAQVVHWRGETWRGGQLAIAAFDAAVSALRACQVSTPQYSPSFTTAAPNRIAAVISGPTIVHQYLLVDPRSSSISELSFTTTNAGTPAVPWAVVTDASVLDAMAAPLCAAYLASCG